MDLPKFSVTVLMYHLKYNKFLTVNPIVGRGLIYREAKDSETELQAAVNVVKEYLGFDIDESDLIPMYSGKDKFTWCTGYSIHLPPEVDLLHLSGSLGDGVQMLTEAEYFQTCSPSKFDKKLFKAYHRYWDLVEEVNSL